MHNSALLVGLSLGLPLVFLIFTGFVKSVVRSRLSPGNFYLGLDASIAGMASGILNIVDIAKDAVQSGSAMTGEDVIWKIVYTAIALGVAVAALFITMLIHQTWENVVNVGERDKTNRLRRGIWLGIIANWIGCFPLLIFSFLKVKGLI